MQFLLKNIGAFSTTPVRELAVDAAAIRLPIFRLFILSLIILLINIIILLGLLIG